jgi:hypothetical protein
MRSQLATRRDDYQDGGYDVKLVLAALTAWLLIPSATADAATRTFNAVADASAPSTAHGTASRLVVSGRSRSYIRFKVSLPAGATVSGTSLRLYATALAPAGTSVSRAGNHWSERRLNRMNRPPVTGRRLARDRRSARGWRSLAAGIVRTGPQTFVLSGRTRKRSRYHSREVANGPQLVVSYSTPRSAPATPAGCPVARPQARLASTHGRPGRDVRRPQRREPAAERRTERQGADRS